MKIDRELSKSLMGAFLDQLAGDLWLVVLRTVRVDATAEDCELCGAIAGGQLFPEFASLAIDQVMAEHGHWKYADVEELRLPAHVVGSEGRVDVVPDDDQSFTAGVSGAHRIAVYDADDVELASVDVAPIMTAGSTLSTLTLSMNMLS